MTLELIKRQYPLDIVVFYDSGVEFDAIYTLQDKLKQYCTAHDIQFITLHPDKPFLYSMLDRPVKNRDGSGWHYGYSWCGGRCRWATRHKLNAIRKFKESLGDVEVIDYVGIAADELRRLNSKEVTDCKRYPLVDWGWSEADCLAYCWSRGWHWYEPSPAVSGGIVDLYEVLDRVSCWCCSNSNEKELFHMWRYLPDYWQRLKDLQSKTSRPMKGTYNGIEKDVFYLERKFQEKLKNDQKRKEMEETQLCFWNTHRTM